jgi:hypothetical protein
VPHAPLGHHRGRKGDAFQSGLGIFEEFIEGEKSSSTLFDRTRIVEEFIEGDKYDEGDKGDERGGRQGWRIFAAEDG